MKVIEYYRHQLAGLGFQVDEDGRVLTPSEKPKPFKINGCDIVLPERKYLEENNWDKVHPFHPLSENVLMGMSPTMVWLTKQLKNSMLVNYTMLAAAILRVAADDELQAEVKNPKLLELCATIPKAKPSAAAKCLDIQKALAQGWVNDDGQKERGLLKMYISRDKKIGDESYLRVASVSFPILSEMDLTKICGVKVQKGDRKAIMVVMQELLGGFEDLYGSNAPQPYYSVYCKVLKDVVNTYNKYAAMLDGFNIPKLDAEWIPHADEMSKLTSSIPSLPGNEGIRIARDESGAPMAAVTESQLDNIHDDDITVPVPKRDERRDERREEPRREERRDERREERRDDRGLTMRDAIGRTRGDRYDERDRYDDRDRYYDDRGGRYDDRDGRRNYDRDRDNRYRDDRYDDRYYDDRDRGRSNRYRDERYDDRDNRSGGVGTMRDALSRRR